MNPPPPPRSTWRSVATWAPPPPRPPRRPLPEAARRARSAAVTPGRAALPLTMDPWHSLQPSETQMTLHNLQHCSPLLLSPCGPTTCPAPPTPT